MAHPQPWVFLRTYPYFEYMLFLFHFSFSFFFSITQPSSAGRGHFASLEGVLVLILLFVCGWGFFKDRGVATGKPRCNCSICNFWALHLREGERNYFYSRFIQHHVCRVPSLSFFISLDSRLRGNDGEGAFKPILLRWVGLSYVITKDPWNVALTLTHKFFQSRK